MPNHCSCAIQVNGPEEDMKKFMDAITLSEEELDKLQSAHDEYYKDREYKSEFDREEHEYALENAYPVPKEFDGIHSGAATCSVTGERVRAWRDGPDGKPVGLTQEEIKDFEERLGGCTNAYDWCCQHYGTKWGTYDRRGTEIDETSFFQNFDSAWSPPDELVRHLSIEFPTLSFTLAFAECGAGYWGTSDYQDGEGDENVTEGSFWKPWTEDEDPDFEPDYKPAVARHLEDWGLHSGG
jgi:hypothetical protein